MQALMFLADAVIGFFTTLMLLRFFMQLNRVSFNNQIGHFVVQLTNWAVKPMRRLIPGIAGLDIASVLPAWALQCLLVVILFQQRSSVFSLEPLNLVLMVLWFGLLGVLRMGIWIFIGALFMQAILSWVNPQSPISYPVMQLTQPVLRPIQRIIPIFSGIDLSPLIAIVLLQMLLMVL